MKYFKFTQIDSKTGISVNVAAPVEGPIYPVFPGLNILLDTGFLIYGTVDDSAQDDPSNQCWEITFEEFSEAMRIVLAQQKQKSLENLYKEESDFRQSYMQGKYDDTASIAGMYKYEQSKAYLKNPSAECTDITREAQVRGITVQELAIKIIEKHELFRSRESTIAGIRGKQLDRINSFVFDAQDPMGSYNEWHKTEQIGVQTHEVVENGEVVTKDIAVMVPYYGGDLTLRYVMTGGI